MSRTTGQRFIFGFMILVAGLIVFVMHTGVGVTKDGQHNQIRKPVDPTVLPIVQPDGSETLPVPEAASEEAIEPAPQETAKAPETPKQEEVSQPQKPVVKPAPPKNSASKPTVATKGNVGSVKAIDLKTTDTGFTITVSATNPIGDTSYINLTNPRRLVIDLREKWALKTKNVVRSSSGPVKHIVLGSHPDRLRMVVHFRTPPQAKLDPTFERTGNNLVVTVQMQ